MQANRIVLPAVAGAILGFLGLQPIIAGIQAGDSGELLSGIRSGIVPLGIGIGLLLTALAVARRSRLGYVLGIAAGGLLALTGIALIVLEADYLGRGGFGAALAGPIIVVLAFWTLAWLLYAWRIRRARADFAPGWEARDRPLLVAVVAVALLTVGGFFGIGLAQGQAAAADEITGARVQALVEATAVDAHAISATVGPASGQVEQLAIEITITSAERYALARAPALCLVDLATYRSAAYRPGIACWGSGSQGSAIDLSASISELTINAGTTTLRVDLDGAAARCPFEAGAWVAELELRPAFEGPGSGEVAFSRVAELPVPSDATVVPIGSGPAGAPSACMASMESP